ncbi:MAG TPA: Mur ligase family protein [Opitutales bacterium]|nr:Mur ligase family protein [Opitutales bacterium]
MPLFDPADLAAWTGGEWRGPSPGPALGPLVADTRRLRPGEIFVALRTAKRDGHDYLETARAAGAGAALVAQVNDQINFPQLRVADPAVAWRAVAAAHRKNFPGPVVGITGSAGKTSTKELLRGLLGAGVHSTHANENNLLGVPLTLCGLDPVAHRFGIIEAGISERGEMAELAKMIQPDIAIITLIAAAHLEKLGSIEGVAHEKARLAQAVRPGGWVVMPSSCLEYYVFRRLPAQAAVVAPADGPAPAGPSARLFLYRTEFHPGTGWHLEVFETGGESHRWNLPPAMTPGLAANAALAIVTAQLLGVADDAVQAALAVWQPAALRGEWLRLGNNLFLADCYNANPASLADALAGFSLSAPAEMPRLYIIGGMAELGPNAPALHRAAVSGLRLRPQDRALFLGPNAEDYRTALFSTGHASSQLSIVSLELAEAEVANFSGAIFLKGSRAYALERLLPQSLREGREAHAPC